MAAVPVLITGGRELTALRGYLWLFATIAPFSQGILSLIFLHWGEGANKATHGGLNTIKAVKTVTVKGVSTVSTPGGDFPIPVAMIYQFPDKVRSEADVMGQKIVDIRNGDTSALVAAVRALREDPDSAAAMGRRARAVFEERFDRPMALARHHALLHRVVRVVEDGGPPC